MGDVPVQLGSTSHVLFDEFRHGDAALVSAKGGSLPCTSRDELERTRGDFRASGGDTDDDGRTPSLSAALERASHDVDVTNAFKRVIDAAVRHLHDDSLRILPLKLGGVDEIRRPELARHRLLLIVRVDGDHSLRPGLDRGLNARQTNRAQTEHGDGAPGFHLRRVVHRAPSRAHAASQQTHLFQRRLVIIHLGHRNLVQDGVFTERARAHEVKNLRPVRCERKSRLIVRLHHPSPRPRSHRLAQIRLWMHAMIARILRDIRAVRLITRNHPIARFTRRHPLADGFHDARRLVSQDARKLPLRIESTERVRIRVTQRRVRYLHPHLSALRRGDDDVHEFQWFTRLERHRRSARDRFPLRGRHDGRDRSSVFFLAFREVDARARFTSVAVCRENRTRE